jgi:Flp pilus assembly protein TadG
MRPRNRIINRRKDKRAGNALVEFALGATVLFYVFSGTFQYGYTFYQYNSLANAVTDGAHYAALRPYDSTTATPSSGYLTAVKNMVVYGNPAGGSTPLVPNLATSNVQVSATFANGVPSTVTVYVTAFSISAVFGSTTFTNKPSVTYAYQGIYAP